MRTRKAIRARIPVILCLYLMGFMPGAINNASAQGNSGYEDLLQLFSDWREFETPPILDGAPDYTAEGFTSRYEGFLTLRNRLHRIDP